MKIPINFASKTIVAGGSSKLYELRVPLGYTAYITTFANTLANSKCYIKWDIDGESVSEEKLNYELAPTDNPFTYDPPLVVTKKMIIYGYNEDTADHIFEVIVNGYMLKDDVVDSMDDQNG